MIEASANEKAVVSRRSVAEFTEGTVVLHGGSSARQAARRGAAVGPSGKTI